MVTEVNILKNEIEIRFKNIYSNIASLNTQSIILRRL